MASKTDRCAADLATVRRSMLLARSLYFPFFFPSCEQMALVCQTFLVSPRPAFLRYPWRCVGTFLRIELCGTALVLDSDD